MFPTVGDKLSSRDSSSSLGGLDGDPLSANITPDSVPDLYEEDEDVVSTTSSTTSSVNMSSMSVPVLSAEKRRYLYPSVDEVEPLRPDQVRWFYRESSSSGSNSDKVGKRWLPFIGYDSLRMECQYRELMNRNGTDGQGHSSADIVVVRGGLYEANINSRKCYPIYWDKSVKDSGKSWGQEVDIIRGSWFLETNWQPLDEGFSNQIETEHLAHFSGQYLTENEEIPKTGGSPKVVHNIKFKDFHVDWNSANQVYLFSDATSSKFHRAVGLKLGISKAGYGSRLQRGYQYEAGMDDKPADINHLVFVIHGIGQKMETGSIIKCCTDLRETCMKIMDRYLGEVALDNKRAEFLPVEWRSSLKLDGDIVESITPNKVKGLRTMLNSSAMDILYYTSPLYRSEITQGLQTELNRLYTMFCERHPYFEASGGKVSIIAHSLGSVITYDILTGWNPIQLYDQYVSNVIEETAAQTEGTSDLINKLEKARQRVSNLEMELLSLAEKQHLKTPTLRFRLENFFTLGSPLSVFLALRGIRPTGKGSQDHILPRALCSRLYNIYHPSDPVAYRLEPLIVKHFSTIQPIVIHRHDSMNKQNYDNMAPVAYAAVQSKLLSQNSSSDILNTLDKSTELTTGDYDHEARIAQTRPHKNQSGGRWGAVFSRFSRKSDKDLTAEMTVIEKSTETKTTTKTNETSSVEVTYCNNTEQIDLDYRLDFVLREGKMENAYLAALTSHTSYWTNQDVALFVLTQLYPDYAVQ